MAENIAAEVLRPVIEATVKSVGATIKRQFNYLCCFTSNITTLKDEAEALENTAGDLQVRVNSARDNVQVITREVETWLTKSNHMKDQKKTILDEVPNVESGCLKLRARFSLSKRAKKTADHMEELRGLCNLDVISQPGPSAAMEAVPLGTTFDFNSRKQIEEDIMKILRDGKMNMIGICGMGGLGKTTMAKMIMNRALKDQLFDEVVMAVVSQPVDKLKIQVEIGGPLGLKNLKEETSMANRVEMLHTRLTACTKRVLLVLDDVWERLVIEELGIPRDCKDCTILLTSRNQDVLRAMNVEKVFGMEVLTKEDAWFLFREMAGTFVDDIGLNSAAKEVVEECRGLPIALTTVGSALKDENDKCIWKDAVTQLRKASPNNIPDFIKEVYNPLRVSYDKLESQQAKSVFLLCCLFGEDANIPLNYLTYFCMGLGIFEGAITNLEEARNRMSALIKMLKSRSLLLDGRNEDHVRMHDVVRDVCIFIAKQKGYIGGNDCTWISSFHTTAGERIKLPINLRLLFLSHNYSKQEEEINKFNDCYVEGIRDLQVLFIENYSSLTSLPHTTESLRNLKTLVLNSCPKLETISFVGELVHLEILSCGGCRSIKELPPEMKRLNRLKLLDLSWCRNLERIGGGIISSLVGLEELKMYGSFKKWDSNERENGNATVRELEALTNLRWLEIEIDDPALAAQNMRLSSKLDRFRIRIPPSKYEFLPYSFNKEISLKWEGETCVGEWIEKQLIRDAECLCLTGNGANNVDYMAKSQNIRWLKLKECETMKNIGRTSTDDATVFPHMEYLELDSLPQLEEILDGPISSNSFHNLEKLELTRLPALKQLWKSSSSPVFTNLSSIRIVNCPKLEEILDGPISSNSFHNLKELTLEDLPKQLWKSSSSPVFHNLSSIEIWNCPCLRNLGQLSSIAENNCLSQLQTLKIYNCEMMEQVFLWNEEGERRTAKIMFPKLKEVRLYNLPNLVTLCQGIGSIEFPLLTEMRMYNLPNLITLCQGIGSIEFPLLTKMSIEECPKMKSMVSNKENNCGGSRNADIDDYHSRHLFCQPQNVSFDSLKILAVEGNAFYCQKIPISFFYGLEELTVCGCKGSMSLFTSLIAQIFMNLRELSIRKCYEIVKVIKDEEEEKAASGGERPLLFRKLEKLNLQDLPALKQLWKSSSSPVFHNLSSISISNCPKLEEILDGPISSNSFHNLSSIYIVRCHCLRNLGQLSSIAENNCLSQLQTLEIYNCEMMEQVFLWKEEDNQRNIDTTLAFSELTSLSLKSLPKLTSLCKGIESFEFPQLTQIQVKDCPLLMDKVFSMNLFLEPDKVKMDIWNNQPFRNAEYLSLEGNACRNLDFLVVQNMHLLTLRECSMGKKLVNMTTMDTHFPHLEVLRLVKLTELEEIWDIDAPIQSHSFKNLKELRFEFLPKLKHLWQGSSSPSEMTVVSIFSKLSSLYIYGCHDLCNLLSVTFTSSCLLEELVIESCDRMEQVFIWNEGETQSNIRIPKLKILILDSLPKLTSFCKGTESFEFPLLNRKRISRCPLLKNFVCTDWSPEDHDDSDDDYTHLFCKPDNKENMKLKLQGNMSLGRSRIQECVEYMSLEGDGSTSLDFGVAQSMRCLTLREFSMNLATITTLFPLLEVLCLVNITELEEIWDIDGPTNINELRLKSLPALKHLWQIRSSSSQMNVDVSIFNKLSCIYIYGCHRLCNLFPLSMMGKGSCLLQLETLVIESCDEMEQLFSCNEEDNERNIDTTLVFPELKSLSLKCLPKLTSLCIGIESFEFPRLTQIQLKDCPLLNEKVFPMNLFYEPDKVKIEIWNNQPFRNAEYLSLEGNAYRNLDVRKVQNMRWLIFRECVRGTKLVSVTTMDTLFPRLEVLRLLKLTELEEIWDIDGPNSFQNLKELRLEFLPALKHLWPSEVVSIFNKLSCIYIYGCHKLCNLFSLPVTETDSYLLQLEELVIESCDMIEYLFFWNEGENQSNIHIPKLKVLILDSLPKLTSFCKGTKKIEFPLLDLKRISRCPLLENFVSTDWPPDDHGHNIHLFCEPDNVLTKVEQKMELKLQGNITLARNKIQECVKYMSFERDGSTSSDFGVGESMRCLTFRECSMGTKLMNMTTIATLFPLIKVLTLRECSMGTKLMNMTTIATPFPVLENLCLVNITELEEIWDIDGPKNINELRLKSLPALKHLWQIRSSTPSQMNAVPSFSKLSSIYIYGCHELCNLFSLSVMATGSCLLQLENLAIESCEMLERVFLSNEEESQRSIELPKLKVLKLDSLPRLMSFCEGTESFEFPLLVEMRISRCPLLQNLVSTNQSPIDHDHDSMHLFCKRDKVSFGSLKVLSTARNPFCGHKILVSSFNGLVELRIIEYRSCTSIFSSSIARNLLSLRVLDISKCDEMVQVIQDEEEEEEKVNAGDQITLLFPKLENLALRDLCKLEAFCEWKSDVELPSLIQVVIVRCPKMKNFTRGKDCISKLEILNIEECEMMEEVYLWNDEDQQSDIDTTLVFSELKSLSLKSLRKLSSLCKGIESFEFPMLTQIQVEDCPVLLQNVVSINLFSKSNKAKMEKLMKNQPFRNAEYLSVEGDSYRNLDCKEVHQNMHWMTFRESSMGTKLVNLTAMDTLFPRLEVLRVVKLTELEEIWVIDSPIPSNSFQNLKELRLEFLPAMKHLWLSSSPSQMNAVSIFNKLSCLHIYGCHDLCNLYSLPVTEMNSCLLLLEELVIESCDRMEHVFLFNEGENQSIIHIPNLKVLILDSLPKLTSFCRGIESFDFPSLVQKRISRCPRLENLVSTDWSRDDIHLLCKSENKVQKKMELKLQGNITLRRNKIQECVEYYMTSEGDGSRSLDLGVANNMRCLTFTEFSMGTKLMNMMTIATVFPLLEVMCLVNITELEEIWDIDGPKNLNELRLKSLPALKHLWQIRSSPSQMNVDVSIFNKLSCIYIYGCHKLRNLFPLSMMGRGSCLLQLERLEIENCEMMEQVFLWNGENIHIEKFPKLKFLSLSFLPNLRNICKGIERIQCPQLDKMKIINCPRLESLVYWDKELTFIFNSLRSSQLERGKGANTALQPHMFKREEKRQQQQKEVEEEQRPPTQGGRQCEIEEELES